MRTSKKLSDLSEVKHLSFTVRLQVSSTVSTGASDWIATVIDNRSTAHWVFNTMPGLIDFFARQTGESAYLASRGGGR